MKKYLLLLVLTFYCFTNLFAQYEVPKREFRGVWVATVRNMDWPSSPNLTVDQQKQELITLFDKFKEAGINAVFLQIRTQCDALYQSSIEPWSYWLTGQQGKSPSPLYDPLQFAIDEAHKRGMELHAWFNPYRAVTLVNGVPEYPIAANHVSNLHPEWLLKYSNELDLDPGIPAVRAYLTSVIMDVVRRYNIDGVHWDDYFYSYDGTTNQDSASWRLYNNGYTNIGDWRRNNVNLLVKAVYDSIQAVKPWLKFGISPFGIWKNGVPTGISGLDAYNVIYGDAIAWLEGGYIDYVVPQLYWPFGGGQDYGKLMSWWADSAAANNRHLYVGQASYRVYTSSYSANEIPNEIKFNRSNPNCQGSLFFEAIDFMNNPKGFTDSLMYDYYRAPSLVPRMLWKETNTPTNFVTPIINDFSFDSTIGKYSLHFTFPTPVGGENYPVRFAVYRFDHIPQQSELENGNNLFAVTGVGKFLPSYANYSTTNGNYFVMTSVDQYSRESSMSNVFQVSQIPQTPNLISPPNNDVHQRDTVIIAWSGDVLTGAYQLQVSTDSTFSSNMIINIPDIKDTLFNFTFASPLQKYFWRVKALGFGGNSNYTQTYNFTTGFPPSPTLVLPINKSTLNTINPTLAWNKQEITLSYNVQLSTSLNMTPTFIVLDTTVVNDTMLSVNNLSLNKIYYWRVMSLNNYGSSDWSEIWAFKTPITVDVKDENNLPKDFSLDQNYPNPFNPSTIINFEVPQYSHVLICVYDILGREVSKIVDKDLQAGYYHYEFNGYNLSSGIYFYQMHAGNFISTKKFILIK